MTSQIVTVIMILICGGQNCNNIIVSRYLVTGIINFFYRELAHTVTRVCQRRLHSHESFISYFNFFLKLHEADLLLVRNICSNFCKELFVEDITKATSVI